MISASLIAAESDARTAPAHGPDSDVVSAFDEVVWHSWSLGLEINRTGKGPFCQIVVHQWTKLYFLISQNQ